MAEEKVLSLRDLLLYLRQHEERIFVRAQIEGHWQNVSLTDMPEELWAEHMARFIVLWLLEGAVPARLKTEDEQAASEGEAFEAGA